MGNVLAIAGIAAWMLSFGPILSAAPPQSPEVLEAEYDRADNPRDRAKIAIAILGHRLEQIHEFIGTGQIIESRQPLLTSYLDALQKVDASVLKADHAGTIKNIEKALHRHMLDFDDFLVAVSVAERPVLQPLAGRIEQVHEKVLYAIMFPEEND
jgi:hypothetical protein